MEFAFRPEHLVTAAGVLVQIALAAGVYLLAPRDARHRAFALLLFLNASWDLIQYVLLPAATTRESTLASFHLIGFLGILATGVLIAFVSLYPAPRGLMRHRWGSAALAALTLFGAAAHLLVPGQWAIEPEGGFAGVHATGPIPLLFALWFPTLLAGSLILLREAAQTDKASGEPLEFVAVALLVYPLVTLGGLVAGGGLLAPLDASNGWDAVFSLTFRGCATIAPLLLVLVAFAAWRERGGRAAAIVVAVGSLGVASGVGSAASGSPLLLGVSSVTFGGILAYALAKHKLFGIDVKLRFAISKSTIAAVFIAVFFIASEAAQQFFGDQFESGYLGILAAGALVFAIAPLSRVADRLAEKAVPIAAPAAVAASLSRADAAYRAALQAAMRDGHVTRREERYLAEVAEQLGITHSRALELREAVEEDAP